MWGVTINHRERICIGGLRLREAGDEVTLRANTQKGLGSLMYWFSAVWKYKKVRKLQRYERSTNFSRQCIAYLQHAKNCTSIQAMVPVALEVLNAAWQVSRHFVMGGQSERSI